MSTLARACQDRGHRVTFFGFADSEQFLANAGVGYQVICREAFPEGHTKEAFEILGKLKGLAGVRHTIRMLRDHAVAHLQSLPSALQSAGVDMLVIDQFYLAGATIGDHLRLPYVHVANALLANANPALPPINLPWDNSTSLGARLRNRMALSFMYRLFQPVLLAVNEQRKQWGLTPYPEMLNARLNARPQICQQPKGFEFPRHDLPSTFHFVGPLHDSDRRAPVAFPWERLDGRPLLYASMGTLQNGLEWVFRTILQACDGLDVQLVLSLGGNAVDSTQLPALAGAVVIQFAPQLELLSKAALCITHAGLNTALEALSQGVPTVAIPITNDQPGVAARIDWAKVGVSLPLAKLTPRSLRQAIQKVLAAPLYRHNALQFQKQIAATDPLARACDVIEAELGSGRSTYQAFAG